LYLSRHMKKIALFLIIGLCALSFRRDANKVYSTVIDQMRDEGFNRPQVMRTLFQLTDVNGPRLTGSQGMKKAQAYARQQLAEWGLRNTAIEPWGGFGKGWEIKKSYVAMVAPYYQPLIGIPRAWTPGTNGLERGTVTLVKIDSWQDMAKYAGSLRGKIVVLNTISMETRINFSADATRLTASDLEKITRDPHIEEGPTDLSQKAKEPTKSTAITRRQIDSFLYREGVLGVLSGGRGTMGTVFTSNGASRKWDAPPVCPELELGYEHLARIVRLIDAGQEVKLDLDINTEFATTDSIECNVIAEIPGTDPNLKDEVVMLGAHLDSWHASTGTTDNATGCAVAMEAVRILKAIGAHPRRTIRIALWSGEEQGLLGSRGYVKKHFGDRTTMKLKAAQATVSAYYNLDNGAGKIRGIHLQNNERLRGLFESWMQPFGDLGATAVTIKNTGSTDHISFDEVGIPGFQFIQDPLEYGTRTHHTNMDSYDRVNANDLMQASIIMASFVYHTAMLDERLPRKKLPAPKTDPNNYR
jgi:carboxypeptidase Q